MISDEGSLVRVGVSLSRCETQIQRGRDGQWSFERSRSSARMASLGVPSFGIAIPKKIAGTDRMVVEDDSKSSPLSFARAAIFFFRKGLSLRPDVLKVLVARLQTKMLQMPLTCGMRIPPDVSFRMLAVHLQHQAPLCDDVILCYAIMLPGRESGFRAGFRPDSSRESESG